MINKIVNNWPLVLAQKPDMYVIQNNSGLQVSSQSRNDTIILEKKISHPALYLSEKGKLVDIYA
ncbi:MAG: hypothetical protein KJ826_17895 [Proteobacteria bacterium]|nr:hypothetical protein [Pseudomonadota bacterium]